jgi:hypothetical protein
MILYVNGDSHSIGHGIAGEDKGMTNGDYLYADVEEAPHPDNLPFSFGAILAKKLNANLVCQGRSGGSIDRSIRTTKQFVYQNIGKIFVLLAVPSYEREEWLYENTWYQINSGGYEILPMQLQNKYKEWVINYNDFNWGKRAQEIYNKLFNFHQWLTRHNLPHLFFNTVQSCQIQNLEPNVWFLNPNDINYAFIHWAKNAGFTPDKWNHYGADAHAAWAELLLPHIQKIIKQ